VKDDGPQCKGMTTARVFPAGSGRPDVPSRPCKSKARAGRDYCPKHEPDIEFNEAVGRQNAAEKERQNRASRQRAHDERLEWDRAVDRRLAQLAKLILVPDANAHRCRGVGVLSQADYGNLHYELSELPELVQCDSYTGHPEGAHICVGAAGSYGQRSVEWRLG
jgi:hypothetical protein